MNHPFPQRQQRSDLCFRLRGRLGGISLGLGTKALDEALHRNAEDHEGFQA